MAFGLGKMFGGKAKDAINQFSGNKDFLEGMCAICAWVAAAEGGVDDDEYNTVVTVLKNNTAISAAFGTGEIETVFAKMTAKTGTRSGKAELKREISEVIERDKTGSMGQAMMLAALDVADSGGISEAEEKVLREAAKLCNVDYDKIAA